MSGLSVSIIIPVLNEADRIGDLLNHLPDSIETIVVDGGSTDSTVEIAASHDLGAAHALAHEDVDNILIIGTDCPELDELYLEGALRKLSDHDAVLGPAEDGGYGLIGLRCLTPELFSNISWSTSEVCAETCRRMNTLSYKWSLLPLLWDVDRPGDLERIPLGRS